MRDFPTEADEASNTKDEALTRFEEMVVAYRANQETAGVVDMYELAAIEKGATSREIQAIWHRHVIRS
jgi:hypothetical protein